VHFNKMEKLSSVKVPPLSLQIYGSLPAAMRFLAHPQEAGRTGQ